MPISLPVPDRRPLAAPELPLVVCQVRIDEQEGLKDGTVGRSIYEALGGAEGEFPKLTQLRASRVTITPAAALPAEQVVNTAERGWRFTSEAPGAWMASVLPDSLALETNQFPGWDDMRVRFRMLLEAVEQVAGPTIEERLGLRFVNLFTFNAGATLEGWAKYVTPEALGLGMHRVLGPGVMLTQQQAVVEIEQNIHCAIRIGPIRQESGRIGFLIDLDAYREVSVPFDVETIIKTADKLNEAGVSVFHQLVTEELLDKLGRA